MRHPSLLVAALLLLVTACSPPTESAPVEPTAPPPAAERLSSAVGEEAGTLAQLRGRWQSTDDPAVTVRIGEGRFVEFYDGQPVIDEPVRIASTCEGASPASDLEYIAVGQDLCYVLVELTESELSYSMVGGRGNTLPFRRIGEAE